MALFSMISRESVATLLVLDFGGHTKMFVFEAVDVL